MRAGLSRTTFYALFASIDDCVAALLDEFAKSIVVELERRRIRAMPWPARMRMGLWVVLACLERDPALARVCLVETQRAGPAVLELRERAMSTVVAAIEAGAGETHEDAAAGPLTAYGVVAAGLAIISSKLDSAVGSTLTELHAELTGIVLLPYLGPEAARRERTRRAPAPIAIQRHPFINFDQQPEAIEIQLAHLKMRLTHRTALVLERIAEHPGASNRAIAEQAGIGDPGQASRLLSRLEHRGLIVNQAATATKWEHNAWNLTPLGWQVMRHAEPHRAPALGTPHARHTWQPSLGTARRA
jgi:AcrR family transcriptional regulator/DNA-binding MarR family transcriptional regulator